MPCSTIVSTVLGSAPADYSGILLEQARSERSARRIPDASAVLGASIRASPSTFSVPAPRCFEADGGASTSIHRSSLPGLDASAGVQSATINGVNTFAELAALNVQGTPVGVQAVDRNSDRTPYSDSYSFTISQRTPFRGLMEASYVGNQSKNLLNNGYAGSAINKVPYGALFQPGLDPNNANIDQFRPLQGFQSVNIITHGLYQNYNSLQLSWSRTVGTLQHDVQLHVRQIDGYRRRSRAIGPVQSEQQLWCASV